MAYVSISLWTAFRDYICSYEHEKAFSLLLDMDIAQTNSQTSTDGIEFMDSRLKALIDTIRAIRDQADSVLRQIEQRRRESSLAGKCSGCGHIKHSTPPALAERGCPMLEMCRS